MSSQGFRQKPLSWLDSEWHHWKMDARTTFVPHIEDDSGYRLQVKDIPFLGLVDSAVHRAIEGECPLGMDLPTYGKFCRTLTHALACQGADDAEIRIQGSSVRVFSGAHKRMPADRTELTEAYVLARRLEPRSSDLDNFETLLREQWPEGEPRPFRRMFDVMYRVGVHPQLSDYDVQISSDRLISILKEKLRFLGADPERIKIPDQEYDYVKKEFIDAFLLNISAWVDLATALVKRPVSLVVFGKSGPPELIDSALSSHHKLDDWFITRPTENSP